MNQTRKPGKKQPKKQNKKTSVRRCKAGEQVPLWGGAVYTKYRGGQSQRMVSADIERTNRLIAAGPGGPNRPLLQ